MSENPAWKSFGFDDVHFKPLALLNGGLRRAVWERTAWKSYDHTTPTQKTVLNGGAGTSSSAMADVTKADFLANLETLPSESVFSGVKPMLMYLREKFESNSLWPQIRSSDCMTGDYRLVIDQFPSSWTGSHYVDGTFLQTAGVVTQDPSTGNWYDIFPRFMRQHEAYALTRRFLDLWKFVQVSICPWMRTADLANETITASQDLLDIAPHGWWITYYKYDIYDANYAKYPLDAAVPCDNIHTNNCWMSLWLDGRDFLRFQADT